MKLSLNARPIALLLALQCVPALSQTVTNPPSPAASGDFMDQLLSAGKSLLDSYYPLISGVDTFTIPSSVVIDGSTYKIPTLVLPTPTSSSSSDVSSSGSSRTSASQTNPTSSSPAATPVRNEPSQTSSGLNRAPTDAAAQNDDGGAKERRLGIILGVVFGLLALAILALIIFLVRRRKKRTGSWLRHEKPPSDDEVAAWRSGHSTRVWSDKDSKYAPIVSSAPHMASREPTLPFAGGAAAASRPRDLTPSSSEETREGFHTPPSHSSGLGTAGAAGVAGAAVGAAAARSRSHSHSRSRSRSNPRAHVRSAEDRHSNIDPVPDPYAPQEELPHEHRPPTPLMHTMFGAAGKAPAHETGLEKRNSIPRKPVPAPIRTSGLPHSATGDVHENPFASPDDSAAPYDEDSARYGGVAALSHRPRDSNGNYVHRYSNSPRHGLRSGEYYEQDEYGPAPVLPPRSPERRHSPQVHYPSGPEVSKFDFGLTREQLDELRGAGDGPYKAAERASWGPGRRSDERRSWGDGRRSLGGRGDVERQWSFERHGGV